MIKYIATKPQKNHGLFCPHHPSSGNNVSTPKYSLPEGCSHSSMGAVLPAQTQMLH